MNPDLERALDAVLADLRAESGPPVRVRDEEWSHHPRQVSAFLDAPDGCGQGVSCLLGDTPAEQLRSVADQVQEWAHEEMGRLRVPVAWPRCPAHPGTHPLTPVVIDESAWWVCLLADRPVSPIGQLAVTARSSRPTRGGR